MRGGPVWDEDAGRRRNGSRTRTRTHLIPIALAEGHGWRAALDARAVDEHVDLAAHRIEGLWEDALHVLHVGEVALDDGGLATERADGVERGGVGRIGPDDKADVGTGLCECKCAGCADSWRTR